MDLEVRQELHATIEKITHTGNPSLDPGDLKKIKSICRQSDINIRTAYELLMRTLKEDHAEVRLSTFQVISDLFTRSSLFRDLLTSDFKAFASLVTGTDTKSPLPPPKEAAARLKKSSLLAIREWSRKYSHGYPKLKLGFNFLKFNKKVDFEQLVSQNEAERRRRAEREARQQAILHQRIQEVKQEIAELRQEIDGCLTEMEACFTLLLPRFELPDIYSSSMEGPSGQDATFSQDNLDVVASLRQDPACSHSTSEDRVRRRHASSCGSFVSLSGGSEDEMSDSDGEGGGSGRESPTDKCEPAAVMIGTGQDTGSDAVAAVFNPHSSSTDSDSDSEVEWEDVEPAPLEGGGEAGLGEGLQEHGMAQGFSVPVQLSRRVEVRETEDNSSILATLHERRELLLHHHLPSLSKCMEWMMKAGESDSMRTVIDLKGKVTGVLDKYSRLNIIFRRPRPQEPEAATPPEQQQQQPAVITHTDPEWKFGAEVPASVPATDLELDPTTPQAQVAALKKRLASNVLPPPRPTDHTQSSEAGSSKNSDLLSRAPVVPFGMDLYHWESSDNAVEPRTLLPAGSLHRFWVEEKEVKISKDEQDRLKCRTISFPGQFQPVARSCRAPLPSGKLCPRKDRHKCPFHGPIIPRDESGQPTVASSGQGGAAQSVLSADKDTPPLWEDEQLQREVMAATGVEVEPSNSKGKKRKGRGGGKKKPKFPGLTDLNLQVDTPRKRMERRVLNKRSLKRVAERVNALATKKYNDKFGDNFNYALKN